MAACQGGATPVSYDVDGNPTAWVDSLSGSPCNPADGTGLAGSPTVATVPNTATTSNSNNVDFLSGLGNLFSGIGSAVGIGLKASNTPTPGSGWVYNPATGLYTNPATGQVMTATGTITSAGGLAGLTGSPITLLLLAGLGYILLRKRAA
jgi:hypothetical protein